MREQLTDSNGPEQGYSRENSQKNQDKYKLRAFGNKPQNQYFIKLHAYMYIWYENQ